MVDRGDGHKDAHRAGRWVSYGLRHGIGCEADHGVGHDVSHGFGLGVGLGISNLQASLCFDVPTPTGHCPATNTALTEGIDLAGQLKKLLIV